MESIKVLTYRFDKILNRSIPDKVQRETNEPFSLKEIGDIIKAALIMSDPDQVKRIK